MEIDDLAKAFRNAAYAASPQKRGQQAQSTLEYTQYMQVKSSEQVQAELIAHYILSALACGFERVCKQDATKGSEQ